jgi:type IV secretory pathway TrbD component
MENEILKRRIRRIVGQERFAGGLPRGPTICPGVVSGSMICLLRKILITATIWVVHPT